MQKSYYVGEGPEAKVIIDAAFAKVQAFRDAGKALTVDMPAGTMICAKDGGEGAIIGFGMRRELSFEEQQELGLSPDVSRPDQYGNFIPTYKPNARSNKGKKLRKRMNEINKFQITFSKAVINLLKIDRLCWDSFRIFMTSAGCKDDKLFVSIPGTPNDDENYGDKFPEIPEWFRPPQGDEAMFFFERK